MARNPDVPLAALIPGVVVVIGLLRLLEPDVLPYVTVLLLVLPWLALAALSRWRQQPFPAFDWFALLCGSVFLLRDQTTQLLLEWPAILLPCVLLALAWKIVRYLDRADRSSRPFLAVALVLYCPGAVRVVNAQFDHANPELHSVRVLSKHISRSHYLKLATWGPHPRPTDLRVTPTEYEATRPGDSVCFLLHPGVLRIPWYEAAACAPSDATSTP